MSYYSRRGRNCDDDDDNRYSSKEYGRLGSTLRRLEEEGRDIGYDRDSGCYYTSNRTILPDGTEIMDM